MRVEKGSKKESGQGFSPWALSLQSPLHSARRLLGLKGPLGSLEILSDQHSIWIIYPRPNGACIAQRSCFDSLLQGRGHFSRKKADGFDYQIIGALGTYQISFRVVSVKDQIVTRTTTRLKVNRARNSKISTVPKSKSSRRRRRWSKRRAMNNSLNCRYETGEKSATQSPHAHLPKESNP